MAGPALFGHRRAPVARRQTERRWAKIRKVNLVMPADSPNGELLRRVASDPRYQALVARRSRFTWLLTAIMLVVFFGYILVIAFCKDLLAIRIGEGTTTWGIPIGLGVIIVGIALTGVYVRRANRDFDLMVRTIREDLEA